MNKNPLKGDAFFFKANGFGLHGSLENKQKGDAEKLERSTICAIDIEKESGLEKVFLTRRP